MPQGSHLGPLLFLIYINDIGSCFLHSKFLLYADDCKIFSSIRTNADCIKLQSDLYRFNNYCYNNKLFLNYDKCSKISFSRKRYNIDFSYSLGGESIKCVSSIKDLGVILDSKLLFSCHIEYVFLKAMKQLGFILRTTHVFSNLACIKSVYMAYVNSILSFCSVVWNPMYHIYIDRLESVQRRFIRCLARKFHLPYCDYSVGCSVFGLAPLYRRRFVRDMCFLYKLVNGHIDAPELLALIDFNVPRYLTRDSLLFRIPPSASNAYTNSPILRIMDTYNKVCQSTDMFSCSFIRFKNQCLFIPMNNL